MALASQTIPQKSCTLCKAEKPISEFYKQASQKDGYRSHCKDCVRDYHRKYSNTERGKELKKSGRKKYLQSNKGREWLSQYRKSYRKTARGRKSERDRQLRSKYGITEEEYQNKCHRQSNKCTICHKVAPLVIDHCHTTGKVRGLLCQRCNAALGLFDDNVGTLLSAIRYLQ